MKLASVLYKFLEYCNPMKNTIIFATSFFTYMQQEAHIYRDFLTEFKRLSFECELDNLQYF